MNNPWFKMCIYVGIAMLTAYVTGLKDYTGDQLAGWTKIDWSIFIGAIVLQGLLVLRTFLDQSLSRYEIEQKAKNGGVIVAGPALTPVVPPAPLAPPVYTPQPTEPKP